MYLRICIYVYVFHVTPTGNACFTLLYLIIYFDICIDLRIVRNMNYAILNLECVFKLS